MTKMLISYVLIFEILLFLVSERFIKIQYEHTSNKFFGLTGTRECKELDINVKCDHRANVRQTRQVSSPPSAPSEDTYILDTIIPVEE
jgi:hypothetical protein